MFGNMDNLQIANDQITVIKIAKKDPERVKVFASVKTITLSWLKFKVLTHLIQEILSTCTLYAEKLLVSYMTIKPTDTK